VGDIGVSKVFSKLRLRKRYVVKYKYKSGETGEIELDHKPAGAIELRELLGIDNICEELEYIRVYENNKLIYTYPCPKKRRDESELDSLAKDLLKDFVKEAIEELRAKRSLTPKDVLAQILAEYNISRDLYNALKEIYERESGGSSFFSDLANFLRLMREFQALNTLQQAQQLTQQMLQESVTNTVNGVAQVLSQLMQMSPQEREKVLNEALAKISEQFPQLKDYLDKFRGEAESRHDQRGVQNTIHG
jgi:hypothetical protein